MEGLEIVFSDMRQISLEIFILDFGIHNNVITIQTEDYFKYAVKLLRKINSLLTKVDSTGIQLICI